jgi:hypothetical protein
LAISLRKPGTRSVRGVVLAKAATGGSRGGLVRHWDRSDSYNSEKVDVA